MFTETELLSIHRTFGHPSVKATTSLLKRAEGVNLDTKTRRAIQKISAVCKTCQNHAPVPRIFKLTVGISGLRFNHSVQMDTLLIHSKPALHMEDVATHFSAATFLRSQSTRDIWKAVLMNCVYVYAGPPDAIIVDQRSAYISN